MLSCNKKVKKVKFPKSCKKPTLYGGASKANLFFSRRRRQWLFIQNKTKQLYGEEQIESWLCRMDIFKHP